MKNIFFLALLSALTIGCSLKSIAQTGVTKYGTSALVANAATSDYNTGLGYYVLGANTSGNRNTGSGANALRFNTTGIHNTAIGAAALYRNTTASYNSAAGAYALFSNTSGYENTAFGNESMYFQTAGSGNTAIGYRSLYNNIGSSGNTAHGHSSLLFNSSGRDNTATGCFALNDNTAGNYNTAIGRSALFDNTTGSYNTAIGYSSLRQITTGSTNTALGSLAGPSSNISNSTAIGYGAIPAGSNRVRFGNESVTSIGGQVGWTSFSDGRFKKDVKENVPGLAFINSLRPVTYTVNVKGLNEFYNKIRSANGNNLADIEDKTAKAAMVKPEDAAATTIYNGFVAQEVELAAKKLNFEFSGVDKPETEDGLYSLRYDNFISPLVKAVQELSAKNVEKESLIGKLESSIAELRNQLNQLKSLATTKGNGGSNTTSTGHLK